MASGAKLGHGAATGEPRAGRCQVEREDGRTSEVKSTAPRDTRLVDLASETVDRVPDEWGGQKCTKVGSTERNVKQMLPVRRGSWREGRADERGTCPELHRTLQAGACRYVKHRPRAGNHVGAV